MEIFLTLLSFRLTSVSGVEGQWILRVHLLEIKIHSHKNCIVSDCFNTPFQITIEHPCLFCMLTLLHLALCSHPHFAPSKNPMKPPWYGKCFDRQIWHFSKRNNLNSSRFLLALFTVHHMWHMSSLLHTFQSSYFSKRGITCSPTTIYCYRIYRSFSHMQTCLAILLPYRDNNGSCTFLRKAPGKHGSYKFFYLFLLSPYPYEKIFWANSSESTNNPWCFSLTKILGKNISIMY